MTSIKQYQGIVAPGVATFENHYLIEPKFYSRPDPKPGVMFVHGAGGGGDFAISPLGRQSFLTNTLIDGTGAVGISHDLGGMYTWGNATAMARMTATYNYLQTLPGVKPGPVWLSSSSMGAHTSLNWAAQNKSKVKGIISIIPVINPTDIVTYNREGYGTNPTWGVNVAYAGGWSEATYGATYNPQTLASAGKLTDIPMLFWYGTLDALCVPAETEAFAAKPGMNVTLIPIVDGHTFSAYDKPDHQVALKFMKDRN